MLGPPTRAEMLLALFAIVVFILAQVEWEEEATQPLAAAVTPRLAATAAAATTAVATPSLTPTGTASPAAPTAAASPAAEATTRSPDTCNFRDELERVRGAVVRIRSAIGISAGAVGTGFHIGNGEYVTAAHVVQDDRGDAQREIWVESAQTGRSEPAEVVRMGSFSSGGRDQRRDLALLRAPAIEHSIAYRAPTSDDDARDVRALGYPWSQAQDDATSIPPPVVLRGVLSSTAERNAIEIVQSDVRVQSGMSGGPLVDECGDALAVAASLPRAPGNVAGEGIGVFISMAELEKLP